MPNIARRFSTLSIIAVLLTALTLAVTAFSSAPTASAATHHKTAHDAQSLPAEGIFDDCNLDAQLNTCEQRLQTIHQGGFQVVVMGAMNTTLASLSSYASYAQSIGMKVMWEISDPNFWQSPSGTSDDGEFTSFSTACGCTENSKVLAYMVNWLSNLSATYGYYAADDSMISPGQGAELTAYTRSIKAVDPNHTVLVSANAQQGESNEAAGDMLASEIYPVTNSDLSPESQHLADWQSVDQSVEQAQHAATAAGKPSAFILQAFTFGDNLDDGEAVGVCTPSMTTQQCSSKLDYPSAATQLQLRNEVLEHSSAKLILWYSFEGTYGEAGNESSDSIYPSGGTAANRWSGLTSAIKSPYPDSIVAQAARAGGKKTSHKGTKKHNASKIVVAG
jgi:hypothetical protein